MKMFIIFLLNVWSLVLISVATNTEVANIRRDLNFPELAKYDGYISETHTVRTEDGYFLTVYRVKSRNCTKFVGSNPIIFMHGLFLSGDDCIIPGPSGSHCYEYANACRDVWVPNSRGTIYSRKHERFNPDKDPEFWNFSFEEMALYDTPAVIDYVLQETGKKQIAFIGHSQGFTLFLNLCAAKPEYNEKISFGFGLSPTAWLDHCKFFVIQIGGALSTFLSKPIEAGLNAEFLPRNGIQHPIAKLLCGTSDLSYTGCSAFLFAALGYNKFQIPEDTLKVMTGHIPGGTSLKNFNRWGQIHRNGFTHYDYGLIRNIITYGKPKPPVFDLSKVSTKLILIGSKNDYICDERDLDTLMPKLSNATKCIVSDKTFGHLDYLYGKDVPTLITPMFLSYLETGKFECL